VLVPVTGPVRQLTMERPQCCQLVRIERGRRDDEEITVTLVVRPAQRERPCR
jgi:hypothetical protein